MTKTAIPTLIQEAGRIGFRYAAHENMVVFPDGRAWLLHIDERAQVETAFATLVSLTTHA